MIFSRLFSSKKSDAVLAQPVPVNAPLWALIDIQSGLVRGSIVCAASKNEPKSQIIYTTTHPFAHVSVVNSGRMTKLMLKGVEDIASRLAKDGIERARIAGYQGKLGGMHYIISSPWIISRTKSVKMEYAKQTTVTRSGVNKIIEEAQKSLVSGGGLFDSVSVEQKVFEVKLNGYSVADFEGKMATTVEISFAVSVSSQHILDKIREAAHHGISGAYPREEHFHSALLLEYAGLRNVLGQFNEYMIIHAHNELTDIVMIKNGMCSFISSFPFGIGNIVRKLGKAIRQSESGANSTLTLFDDAKLTAAEEHHIKPVIEGIGQGWLHDLSATLAHAGDTIVIPRTIILSTHSHFSFIKSLLEKYHAERGGVDIIVLHIEMIEAMVRYSPNQEKSMRMGIYTSAIAALSKM